jgi:two-component system, sensor histidine kinase and response regulator
MKQGNRILVVDDNANNIKVVAEILMPKGYRIAFAQSADEAFRIIDDFLPDLVLLDIMMPVTNGYEVCKRLKSDEKTEGIPVIFLTAKNQEEDIEMAYRSGGVDYLTKPFFREELLARVETHLNLKNSYNTILRQNIMLEEANDAKNKLFSVIGHDMRTPIASIHLLIDNLLHRADLSDTDYVIKSLRHIEVSANETFQLLDNLLSWARNQLNSIKCTPVFFDPGTLIEKAVKLFGLSATGKNIGIEFSKQEETIVFADEVMILSVVRNLIQNAIKYSFENGSLLIETKTRGEMLEVMIEDHGVGIDADISKILFSPQVPSIPGTRGEKGTGLGLGICKLFIEMNKGKIWFESAKGRGSKFFFSIPRKK